MASKGASGPPAISTVLSRLKERQGVVSVVLATKAGAVVER
jgi:hypothetical protein